MSSYIGEICNQCEKSRLVHPEAYIYTCLFCRYSYKIDPVVRGMKCITILHKSEVKKLRWTG